MSQTVNTQLVLMESIEAAAKAAASYCRDSVQSEVNDMMSAITDYKNEVYAAAGGGRTDTPVAASTDGSTQTKQTALGAIQAVIDSVESNPPVNLSKGGGNTNYGYPNDLRVARAALIAALYTLYAAEYATADPS